jgi:hypothetical protein
MHKASKIGILAWTIFCFIGACSGMMNVASHSSGGMSDAEAAGVGLGMFFWILIWFFPTVGLGVIALITKPKSMQDTKVPLPIFSQPPSSGTASLCVDCGKYYSGTAKFCPYCGKPQQLLRQAEVGS